MMPEPLTGKKVCPVSAGLPEPPFMQWDAAFASGEEAGARSGAGLQAQILLLSEWSKPGLRIL